MKEYISQYKNYDDYSQFKPGYYLDALDQHRWKLAQIKQITRYGLRTTIEVHFDGFSSRYDTSYDLPSSHKLAPFRTHTLPYTGMQTLSPNRQQPQQSKFAPIIKEMARIGNQRNVQKLKTNNLNQFLRGQVFILVDNLITKRNLTINLPQIVPFLDNYAKEGIKILINSAQYLKDLEKQPLFDPALFTVHPKIAVIMSNIEFLFVMNTIIGNKDQRAELLKKERGNPSFTLPKKVKDDLLDNKVMNALDIIMKFKCVNGKTLPWSLKKQVCILYNSLIDQFSFEIPTDHRQMLQILDYMSYFSQKGLLQKEQQQKKSFKLIVSLIIHGNFQGRLRGLNQIKKVVQSIFYKRKQHIVLELTNSDLLSFLIDNKNFNQEIFKRSLPLFAFFYSNKMINKKQLLQILNLHKDKHQLELKGFFSSLAEFTYFLDAEVIIQYFKDIASIIPLNQLSITFIKDYTLGAINKNMNFKSMYCKEGWELGLTYFWTYVTSEKVQIPFQMKQKMIEAFALLMAEYYYQKQIQKYIGLAIKGIANRKNLEVYYKLIDEILKISKGPRISKCIEAVEKDISIVECVIEGIKNTEISDKMWECMFQFLEEVTYVSKRKITYSQIKQFWKLKVCRPYLLKFLRKYRLSKGVEHKSHQKIIKKQLPIETIKEILQKLFLDSKQMQDYQNIGLQLYQTVDQLIMALNNSLENIDYNYKHTIRTRNPQKIIALQFYVNLANKCKSMEIVEKSIHRIIELCIRISQGRNTTNGKLSHWKFLLDKISKLKKYNLLGYKFMLEDLKGRMKSLNVLEPDPVQMIVYNKFNQERKMISVPRYTSLWKIRHVIGEEFSMPQLNFQMKITGSRQTDFYQEQDFSTALITVNKEGPSIFITPTKQRHPHLDALSQFYQYFVQSKGDQLYEMLSRQQGKQALQILNKLPFFKKIQQKLDRLSFKDPSQIMDSNSMLKLSYQLKMITSIKNIKHSCSLIQKGFLSHISKIFLNKNLHNNSQNYVILTNLISFLSEIIKFSKMVKNPQLFNDSFLCELLHINSTITPEYVAYIAKCFTFLRDISVSKELLLAYKLQPAVIFQNKQIDNILQALFLAKTEQKLAQMIVQFAKNTGSQSRILRIAINILSNPIILQKQQSCRILFDVLSILIDKTASKELQECLKRLNQVIHKEKIIEDSEQKQNQLLIGVMGLMIKFIQAKVSLEMLEDLLGCKIDGYFKYLIEECLFNFKDPHKIRFKSSRLRELGYRFINKFNGPIKNLTSSINRAMKEGGSWRKQEQWSISLIKQNPHVFTGLKNLAATCYINSLLQQLFFIENFRNEIIAIDAQKIDDKENIVLQIQNIFAHLKYSETSIFNTSSLCKKFILDGQPIDPRVQTDVDQFFHSLMDKLQRNLNKISKKSIINNIFGGELSNLIVGSKCQHTSERIQSFLSIRLQIKDKGSLQEAFKQFIKGEALQGDNAYFCQRCDQKIKATKRVCLKTLPQILIITLKRFEFNYQTMEKFKLNTLCSFSQLINVLQYTKQGIQNDHDFDESNYQYKLKGVVIHYGISEAGHYTSYIQAEEQKWYYFDDEKITQFSVEELGNQCFGGIQENPFGDDEEKKKNAYLLFYEKVKKNAPKYILNISQAPIVKQVYQQNARTKLVNLLFQPNLCGFIINMKSQDTRTLIIYFHLVFLRSAYKRQKLEQFYTTIQQILRSNKETSAWYLSQINQNFLNQFIFLADLQVRYIVTGLLIQAFKCNANTGIGELFLQQLMFFVGKKNFYPAGKIFKQAIKIKYYQKFLLSFNIGDILYQLVKNPNKDVKFPKQLRLKKSQNDFGSCYSVFTQRVLIDTVDFLQAIDSLKLNFANQDVQLLVKRTKRAKTQQSLAIVFVRKYLDYDKFDKIEEYLAQKLDTVECVGPDEYIYNLHINMIEQFASIKDAHASKRIQKLVKLYMKSLQYNLCGYRCPLLLLLGLFKICSKNEQFRDRISEQFQQKEGKKLLKDIKIWVKQINANLSYFIRIDKIGVWRKPKGDNQSLEYYGDQKINDVRILQSLNAITQKHHSFLNSEQQKFQRDQIVKFGKQKCRHLKSYGLVSQILLGDRHKIVLTEELTKLTYF